MEQNKMAVMPMNKLVWNISLPLMISLLVQALYNIVDSIFVARVGENALTAVSLAFPIQILMIAVSVGTSVGVNALLSRSIGAKREEETANIATTGLYLALAGTVLFMILGFFTVDRFVGLFTQDPAIKEAAVEYLRICMIFCLGTFIGTMYQRFLQSVGDAFNSMVTLVTGALINVALDPLLIFGIGPFPELGVKGAAYATVTGQWVCGILAVILNRRKNPTVQVKFRGFRFRKDILGGIYKVGLPTIVTQALGSIMLTLANAILISFSSTAVAFFGVYYKLQSFLFMPMNGLGQAAIPIAGFSYGAKRYDRIRELLKVMLPEAVILSAVISVIFAVFPGPLLSLFDAGEAMLAIGIPALRIICGTFPFAAVTMILGYTLSGVGNGLINMIGTALRQVVLLIPLMWAFASLWGVADCWWAFWIAEVSATVYAALHSRYVLKKKGILRKEEPDTLQKSEG